MSELLDLLRSAISNESTSEDVALLLSGGIDSVSVGVALTKLGKNVRAYTYELEAYRSADKAKATAIAERMGWPLTTVVVPTDNLCGDFLRLAVNQTCRKKVHFEILFPLLYVMREIIETEIWSGWNADDHYGNTRPQIIRHWQLERDGVSAPDRKMAFDRYRKETFETFDADGSEDTWWYAKRLAGQHNKQLFDPYISPSIREYFLGFDHEQLSNPRKPLVREALKDSLRGLSGSTFAIGVKLQSGGGVNKLFKTLLNDSMINRFDPPCSKVSTLCQRWAKEIARNRDKYAQELSSFGAKPKAMNQINGAGKYHTYTMNDVRIASALRKFTVVSTFSGGGGSSIGYRLAGGVVLIANEFVPEAARTYALNFPNCVIDRRDIREILQTQSRTDEFLAKISLKPGEADIFEGSPPCSEFSSAGKGMSEPDTMRRYSDVQQKNIASLPFDCIELAARIRPKAIVIENVPALLWARSRELFENILDALRYPNGSATSQNYYVGYSVLTASGFGVPQRRKRLFIIGVRSDVGETIGIDCDAKVSSLFPIGSGAEPTVRCAFQDLHQVPEDVVPWLNAALISTCRNEMRLLPKSPAAPIRLRDIFPNYEKSFTLTRASWDHPVHTLVVAGQQPDGLTGIIHPDQDRKFTIPELKRLTGLPDDFILTGTLSQAAERICRMVPPFLTKAIATSIYERVLRPYKELHR